MRIVAKPFNLVFDGTANYVARAILDLGLADVPAVRTFFKSPHVQSGVDGLDGFKAVPLEVTMDDGCTRRFALWRHEHNPVGHVTIRFPLGDEFQPALAGLMAEWNVPESAIIWRDRP